MNTKKIRMFLSSLIIAFVNLSFTIELRELIEKIKQKESEIENIKVSYTQTINFVELKEVYEIKARFLYMRPDNLKIEILSPIKQTVVANSKNIYVKDLMNDIVYEFNSNKYFEKEHNYLPLIFSKKNMKYTVVDFVKKVGLRFVAEEQNYYVLSTKPLGSEKKRPRETRFVMWIEKDTLLPKKITMVSEKYIVETQLFDYEINKEYSLSEFEIEKSTQTKVIKIQ